MQCSAIAIIEASVNSMHPRKLTWVSLGNLATTSASAAAVDSATCKVVVSEIGLVRNLCRIWSFNTPPQPLKSSSSKYGKYIRLINSGNCSAVTFSIFKNPTCITWFSFACHAASSSFPDSITFSGLIAINALAVWENDAASGVSRYFPIAGYNASGNFDIGETCLGLNNEDDFVEARSSER